MVTAQALSTDDAQKLMKASCREIESYAQKWQKLPKTQTDLIKRRPKIIKLLKNISKTKLELALYDNAEEILSTFTPRISASLLLETMFSLVHQKMSRDEWARLPLPDLTELTFPQGDLSASILEETCTEYQTVLDGPTQRI